MLISLVSQRGFAFIFRGLVVHFMLNHRLVYRWYIEDEEDRRPAIARLSRRFVMNGVCYRCFMSMFVAENDLWATRRRRQRRRRQRRRRRLRDVSCGLVMRCDVCQLDTRTALDHHRAATINLMHHPMSMFARSRVCLLNIEKFFT